MLVVEKLHNRFHFTIKHYKQCSFIATLKMVDSNAEETKLYISLYIEDEFESLLVFELDCLTVLFIQSIIFAHFLSLFSLPHECFNFLSHLQGDKMFH